MRFSWRFLGFLWLQLFCHNNHSVVSGASSSSSSSSSRSGAAERQVQERVRENVDHFMNAPVLATSLLRDFVDLGGFPHDLQAPDRDGALRYLFSQVQTNHLKVYYGLETGVFLGYGDDFSFATSREPGESGYRVDHDNANATSSVPNKYWNTCVNRDTGQAEECQMGVGDAYIACQNDCELVPCSSLREDVTQDIEKKWCRNYTIETVPENVETARGYIPRTYHCINSGGQFTQTPGKALVATSSTDSGVAEESNRLLELGDCTFGDGTLVTREIAGPFAYCGGGDTESETCNTTYVGMFRSRDYDPRYRGWYTTTAQAQHPQWSDPYTFFSTGDIGITWADPIYTTNDDDQKIFQGILAVDYQLDAISQFLIDAYQNTDTLVAIFEDQAPNYVVGVSTGSSTTQKVLASDPTRPCPTTSSSEQECEVVRISLSKLQETDADVVFQNAFLALRDAGFPDDSFISVKVDEGSAASDGYYSAISIVYEHPNANLKWRIVVANPVDRNASNTITKGQPLFVPMCLVAGLGFAACIGLFAVFYRRRGERAVIYSDVRFTCAFILGCALLNLATFTFLGENTDELCMARMWSFHFMFALALSPLFVKVYRLWKLVGHATALRRPKITNLQAALYTVPIPAIQGSILLIFSFVDPSLQSESTDLVGGNLVPNVTCEHEGNAFMITQLVFDVSLVCIGCLLAFVSRNMDPKFGEPKQMIFSMYNIAFTGVILIALFLAVDIEEDGRQMLHAIGIFWGTIVSSAAFVVPRLMQANSDEGIHISGMFSANSSKPIATTEQTDVPDSQGAELVPPFKSRNAGA